MKKRCKFLLIIPACMMFLTGCDAMITLKNTKYVCKKIVKKILRLAEDFFATPEAEGEVKVIYHF